MKILQRYVLREIILPFALCVAVLNFIFMAGFLVRAANFIVGRGVPLFDTLYVLLLALPEMVGYTIPTSILTAVLIVFGSLSQSNELRAMKASGINLLQVVTPVFFLGLALSLFMFVFNDQITSNSGFQLRQLTKQMLIKHPKALIEPGRFVKVSDTIIFMTKSMEGDVMKEIIAYEVEDSDKPVRTIMADRGEIITNQKSAEVQIRLYDGSISDNQEEGVHTMQFKTFEFPTFGQEEIKKMQKKKKDLTLAEILIQLSRSELSPKDQRELWTAFNQRISFACASFLFVFVGIPVATLVRRGEIILSFVISMATVSLYYVLFVAAKSIAHGGILPPLIAMWIPNILVFILGFYLLRRSLAS